MIYHHNHLPQLNDIFNQVGLGPFFFEYENGRTATINGNRYRAMLNKWLIDEVERLNLETSWFQQDGASSHTAFLTIDNLQSIFPHQVIYYPKGRYKLDGKIPRFVAPVYCHVTSVNPYELTKGVEILDGKCICHKSEETFESIHNYSTENDCTTKEYWVFLYLNVY